MYEHSVSLINLFIGDTGIIIISHILLFISAGNMVRVEFIALLHIGCFGHKLNYLVKNCELFLIHWTCIHGSSSIGFNNLFMDLDLSLDAALISSDYVLSIYYMPCYST